MKTTYKSQKALTAAIVLALALGVTGISYAADAADVDLSHAVSTVDDKLTTPAHDTVYTKEESADKNINVSMTNTGGGAIGLRVVYGQLAAGNDRTKQVNIYAKGTPNPYGDTYGALVTGNPSALSVDGTDIQVTAESGGNAIGMLSGSLGSSGSIRLGGNTSQDVTIRASTTGEAGYEVSADGIRSVNQGEIAVNGGNLNISAEATGETGNHARGIVANLADEYNDSTGQGKVNVTGQSVTIQAAAENGGTAGIEANGGGQVTVTGNRDLTITSNSKDDDEYAAFGISVEGDKSSVDVSSPKLTITADGDYWIYGIGVENHGQVTAVGQDMSIAATSGQYAAYGIAAVNNGKVELSGKNLTITAAGIADVTAGICAEANSNVTVAGQNLIIRAKTEGTDVFGIEAYDNSHVTINTQNTTIEAASSSEEGDIDDAVGIVADYDGKVTVHNNLRLNPNADPYKATAIDAYYGGQVEINPENTGTVNVRGNILSERAEDTTVTVNLNGKDSSWIGNALSYNLDGNDSDDISRLNLSVMNGASWTADGSQRPTTGNYVEAGVNAVHNLTIANGGKVQVGGTLTISSASKGGTALVDGTSTLAADDIVVNDRAALTVADGAQFNVQTLTSAPGATVTLSNLAVGPKDTELLGATRYNLGYNDWNNPKTLNAADLTVNPSHMEITSTEGFRGGTTTRKLVLANSFTDGEQPTKLMETGRKNLTIGTTLQGTREAELEGNDVYYKVDISRDAQPQTHAAVMAQLAGLATVANGFDFISQAANSMEESGVNAFAAIGGGENKYDTGSHIKTNDWHAVAGVGVKNESDSGSSSVYGIFYDYGDGQYRTFQNAGYGSGKAIYKGGGLFGKYTAPSQFYVEGSFRAGRVENTANGIFRNYFGNRYDLKTNSNYNAFHVGVGKLYTLDDKDSLDVYGKFFHTHINGDSFNAGGEYNLDSVDSNILRLGTRWNHKQGNWNHYLGVAYEYEFDGKVKGTADGARIKSADIGGSSVRFELGTNVITGKWTLGLNANTYAGQHKGFGGSVTAAYKF